MQMQVWTWTYYAAETNTLDGLESGERTKIRILRPKNKKISGEGHRLPPMGRKTPPPHAPPPHTLGAEDLAASALDVAHSKPKSWIRP